ncbi:DUF2514 family protein [Burkholderia multivorans]|uniref:DUF2514 family protein n=1 Tax=Burkholderia multivorans TaxID=87883 RepID=UPI00018E3B4C|nr:DUF2514 family protein [Burkholderia multivorans]EED98587.1 gp23 [Burkholderia multivorans CGD1]MCO7336000.1 DUF2514 domain-containing protein [Burkholderia multivorans]HDR9337725.1 DUF2514 family protein [Burkholderia multivorans]
MTILDPRVWLAFIIALAITAAGCYFKGHHDADQSATVADQAKQIRELKAERDEYQRRTAAQQENANHAAKERDQARADAAAAASAADGLREQVAVLIERARHPAAATGSPTTGDALDLLADVLGRADAAAGELAKIADERGIAGKQCEADYDALTKPHALEDHQ